MGIRLRIKGARCAFPDVHEATQYEEGGEYRYNCTFLVEANKKYPVIENDGSVTRQLSIEEAIKEVAEEAFDKKAAAFLKQWEGNPQKMCYIDGDLKEYDGYAGMWALSAHRNEKQGPVTVLDSDGVTPLGPKSGKPYGGCYVTGSVDIYAQKGQHAGIRAGLRGVRFERHGDAFGGGAPASPDEFGEVDVPEGAEDDVV